jgi:ABC-type uncharacterized transport system fused permease/ATPase subunit
MDAGRTPERVGEAHVADQLADFERDLRSAAARARLPQIGANPDQRIHEDARHLVELSTDLGIGLLQSTLLLICFVAVLWTISDSGETDEKDSPGYFAGDMSLGGLMVAVGAFNQVQQALRWFVDNFSTIADWRATLLRVASFRLALLEMDKLGGETARIELIAVLRERSESEPSLG